MSKKTEHEPAPSAMGHSELLSDDCSSVSRRVFSDAAIYALEQERIFQRNWLYLAHESQLPESGDFVSVYMGEIPVILVRDERRTLNAFVNSCSHRGLAVCRHDSGKAKRFVCPYHNWSYDLRGQLVAVPQERKMRQPLDKAALGLPVVPRIETYRGLIFACLDEAVQPLEAYLGNMRFYLDSYFDRFEGGVEVIGPPHKWRLAANWKLPVENQLGDVGHGPFLHSALLGGSPAVDEIERYGFNSSPEPGHGASFRFFPEDTDPAQIAWGAESIGLAGEDTELIDYLLDLQRAAPARIGLGARIKGLTYGVYPNFSFLWSNSTLRISYPRSPSEVEYWSWWVVPRAAAPEIKRKLRLNYNLLFGPAGMLEQEDSEAWSEQSVGSRIVSGPEQRLCYALGLGEERRHADLPGLLGNCYNELYARRFYQRWRADLQRVAPS